MSPPIHLGPLYEEPIYFGSESNGKNYSPSKKYDHEYFLRGKKDHELTPMQRFYLTDHLASKKSQEAVEVVRRSEKIPDESDDSIPTYTILKRLTPIQRNYIADHLSSFVKPPTNQFL